MNIKLLISIIIISYASNLFAINIDSLTNIYSQSKIDSVKAKTQLQLADYYFYIDTDSARKYYSNFIALNESQLENAYATKKIGICYAFDSNFDSATYFMNKALEVFVIENDSLNIAFSYNSIGLVKINQGDFDTGVEYLFKSIKWKENLKNSYSLKKLTLGSTYLNIGIGFHSLEQYDKALEYYNTALEYYKLEESPDGVSSSKAQIASIYFENKEYEKAEDIYRNLISTKAFEQNQYLLVKVYNNLGAILMEMHKFKEAENIIKEAYQLNIDLGNEFSACKNLNNLSNVYYENKQYSKAIEYALQSFQLSQKTENIQSKLSATYMLALSYDKIGNYKQSVKYYKLEQILKDSINTTEQNNVIAELEGKFQLEKKQQVIKELEQENEIKELKLNKRKAIINLGITAILITLLALIIILNFLRKVKKQEKMLALNNKELTILNESLHKMFAIISHDLRNLISGFKGAGDLVSYYLEKENPEKLKSLASKLSNNSIRLEELLNNLLNWALSQESLFKPTPSTLYIKAEIDNLILLCKPISDEKNIEIINQIKTSDFVYADLNNFNFIVRNILSNAVKFTSNGNITFQTNLNNTETEIIISDTGTGISEDKLKELYQLKKGEKSIGTAGEKGSGLGLKLVKDFIVINKGSIKISSELNKGTIVRITLPNRNQQ